MPSLGMPSLGMPSLGMPSLGMPSLGMPSLGMPSLGMRSLGHMQSRPRDERRMVCARAGQVAKGKPTAQSAIFLSQ
jgi:hypothetical protein